MITAVVFSRNRACQLELLLHSIRQNIPNVFDIHIIYKADEHKYQEAYTQLVNHYTECHFYGERHDWNLERYTRQIINETTNKHMAFFTDDTVVYMLAPLVGQQFLTRVLKDRAVFSLRLGYNTLVQNCHTGEMQLPLNLCVDEGETVSWNFNHHHPHSNYGYPFGLDGHIYLTRMMRDLIIRFRFHNTNQLESELFKQRSYIPQMIRSFKHSIAVNIPCNNQSNITIAGQLHPYSIEELNNDFLKGLRIDLEDIMSRSQTIIGAHQEIKLVLCKPGFPKPKSPTDLEVKLEEGK